MESINYVLALDFIGTFVFAISGALTAAKQRFDLMGVSIIAFVTALGGGTVRDVLLGIEPVGWMVNIEYLLIISAGVLITFFFHEKLEYVRKTLFLFDAMGLGVFAISGLETSLALDIHPVYAVLLGMISGTMGGVIRDILCNVTPLIFRREIYASAGIIGASSYYLLKTFAGLHPSATFLISVALVISFRIAAVRFKLGLPRIS